MSNNFIPDAKIALIQRLAREGVSLRAISRKANAARATVERYVKMIPAACACGRPRGHHGHCASRRQWNSSNPIE